MNRKMLARCVCTLLGGALLIGGLAFAEDAASKPAKLTAKGTFTFGGSKGTWSGKLTPTETPNVYDVEYVAAHNGNKEMTYVGQIETDGEDRNQRQRQIHGRRRRQRQVQSSPENSGMMVWRNVPIAKLAGRGIAKEHWWSIRSSNARSYVEPIRR